MKTLRVLLLLLLAFSLYHSCNAQLKIEKDRIVLHADTIELRQGFELFRYMIPFGPKVQKVVVKDGVEYWQTNYLINRMFKYRAYTLRNGKIKFVKI